MEEKPEGLFGKDSLAKTGLSQKTRTRRAQII